MFDEQTKAAIRARATKYGVAPAVLLAVVEVESAGRVFAQVNGRMEPLIRFEGHYFDRRLTGAARTKARAAGLANPRAGAVKNPRDQPARWRLYALASQIDAQAAFESVSWGVGQVMGSHWKALGFANPGEMLKLVRSGVEGQVEVMMRYCDKFGLIDELQRRDFTAFARGYNGPNFAADGYHAKMAAAYRRLSGQPVVSAATGMLRMGSKGARVREVQALLVRAGYGVNVDGDFGTATKKAVMAFQKRRGLAADGVVGPETQRALSTLKVEPREEPGKVAPLETKEAKTGALNGAIGVSTAVVAEQVKEVAGKVPLGLSGVVDTIVSALYAIAAILVIGGLLWGLYGYLRSRRTDEGDVEIPGDEPVLPPSQELVLP